MKNRFLFLLLFFITVNSSLFAFSNQFFSVSDAGWDVKKKSDYIINFLLKNYLPEDGKESSPPPFVTINVKEGANTLYVVKYDQKELDNLKDELLKKAYAEGLKESKTEAKEFLKKNFGQLTNRQIDEAVDKMHEDSGIKSTSLTKIGSNKAYRIDYKISEVLFRRFVVITLKRAMIIEFTYPDGFDLDSEKAYKDFMASFKNPDHAPTSFNGFIFGGGAFKILEILIVVVVFVVSRIFRRMRR